MTAPRARKTGDFWTDVAPIAGRHLLAEHRAMLEEESNIDAAIIAERGYHSLELPQVYELTSLKVLAEVALRAKGWLCIPTFRPDGTKYGEVVRLFGDGLGGVKYLWPSQHQLTFDVHPSTFDWLDDPAIDVLITEGIKKADALLSAARREGRKCVVISMSGNYGWRTSSELQGPRALPDFYDMTWKNRHVYIIVDSDFRSNNAVAMGWSECAAYVEGKTGPHRTQLVVVPPGPTREKQGADDYLAAGTTLESLLALQETREFARMRPRNAGEPLPTSTPSDMLEMAKSGIPHLLTPLIPESSIMLMAGHTGTYKTWAALDLCISFALQMPWLDHPRLKTGGEPVTSIYVNKEMAGKIMSDRLRLLLAHDRYKSKADLMAIMDKHLVFVNEASLDLSMQEGMQRLEQLIVQTGAKLVVLDSLSMSWHGDENNAREVGMFYTALRDVSERTGVAWLIIHHLLKPTSGRLKKGDPPTATVRGSGQLTQQADVAVLLSLHPTNTEHERLLVMTHAKARTAIELPTWVARFATEEAGLHADLIYRTLLVDLKAHAVAEKPDSESRATDWLFEVMKTMPGVAPGSVGLTIPLIEKLVVAGWTASAEPPSSRTIRRSIKTLREQGLLLPAEGDGTERGACWRLVDWTADDDAEAPVFPATPFVAEEDDADDAEPDDDAADEDAE